IHFNQPLFFGKETRYIEQAINLGKISGDGAFTKKCQTFFEQRYGFSKTLLTTSCTDALEMCALLLDIKSGDEIIIPSFTFVSCANAFVLRGAKIIFADSEHNNPNIDTTALENLITPKTKAILVVHYAGFACKMNEIISLTKKHNLFLIEDVAHGIDNTYNNQPLGSFGDLATYSFHETKNVTSGEGGMLVINNKKLHKRAEIIREKGTNRSAFFRGEIDKYNWIDIGSSFLPADINAAFLYAQLEQLDNIQKRRIEIWNRYYDALKPLTNNMLATLPTVNTYTKVNGHIFYLVCKNLEERTKLIKHLLANKVSAVFHYQPLHLSPYYTENNTHIPHLPNAEKFANCLLRFPLHLHLTNKQIDYVASVITSFYLK
ncbi:UNVERIFIED_CONTAM: hypothetical protein GTU68_014411, partial [Idotea baltica]|nr:hypothetical protein [Idotea baltica]